VLAVVADDGHGLGIVRRKIDFPPLDDDIVKDPGFGKGNLVLRCNPRIDNGGAVSFKGRPQGHERLEDLFEGVAFGLISGVETAVFGKAGFIDHQSQKLAVGALRFDVALAGLGLPLDVACHHFTGTAKQTLAARFKQSYKKECR
jgi:hypothetical protein